jgi:lysophospholipase L1-like esterase
MSVGTAGAAETTGGAVAASSPPWVVVFMELHPTATGGVHVVARAMKSIFFWRVMVRPSLPAGAFGVFWSSGAIERVVRRSAVLPLALLVVAAGPAHCRRKADAPIVQPTISDAAPQFMGRFDTSDPSGPRFAWSASAISARFSGSSISVRLRDAGNNQFQVVVDGQPKGVIATGASRELYPVASGLPPGDHDVTISKRTEANLGEVQFLGFVLGAGDVLRAMPARDRGRRIEFVGDSITAGFGNEGTTPTCPFSAATENEYATYGAITARGLDAEHVTIAWSGKTIDGMAQLYERTLPARSGSHWDFARWVPDAVVINLGVNDFFQGDVRQPVFTTAYVSLIGRIRSHYPRALIVCALGPMLADTYPAGALNLTRARRFLRASIDAVHAKGDARVSFVEFPPQDPMTSGCGFHPDVRTHEQMAQQLIAQLKSELGW